MVIIEKNTYIPQKCENEANTYLSFLPLVIYPKEIK